MSEHNPKLRVFFQNRDSKETAEILRAIADATKDIVGPVDVHLNAPIPAPTSQARTPRMEQLETSARDAASKQLDRNEKAAVRAKARAAKAKKRSNSPDPKLIVRRRKELRVFLAGLCKQYGLPTAIKIVLVAGAKWVAEKIKGP